MKHVLKRTALFTLILSTKAFSSEVENNSPRTETPHVSPYVLNLIPSEKSENLQWVLGRAKAQAAAIDPATLPCRVDFSYLLPKIHDQGGLGSCTGQSVTAAMEMDLNKTNNYTMLSPLYVYYNERKLGGTIKEDSGASLADAIRAVCTWGACKEPTWPYSDDGVKFKVKPSRKAYKEGKQFMDLDSISHSQVPHTLNAIKAVLAQNTPVIFGVFIYPSFMNARVGGKVPMPAANEVYPMGGHALTFVGYNDDTEEFKFANSWGESWGDKGYGYLKYNYVMNKSETNPYPLYFFANDIWSVSKIGKDETEESPRDI